MGQPKLISSIFLLFAVVCSLVGSSSSGSSGECNNTKWYQTSEDYRDGGYLSRCLWEKQFKRRRMGDHQQIIRPNIEYELNRMMFIRDVQALILRSDCTAGGKPIRFKKEEFGAPDRSPWLMAGYDKYRLNYKCDADYKEDENDESWQRLPEGWKVEARKRVKRLRAYIIYQVYLLKAFANDICRGQMHGLSKIELNEYSDRACSELAEDPSADRCILKDGIAPPRVPY